ATGLGALDVSQSANVVSGSDVGTAITVADLGTAAAERWFDAGSNLSNYGYAQTVASSTPGQRYNRSSGPTPATISTLGAATDVTAGYTAQYKVTFKSTGLTALVERQSANVVSTTHLGTALTAADPATPTRRPSDLAGSNLSNYGYAQTVASSTPGKRYNRSSGPTPATISTLGAATDVTAGYTAQYKVTF